MLFDTSLLCRILRSASVLSWLAAVIATAQVHDAAFGEVRRVGLPAGCDSVQVLASPRNGTVVLLASDPARRSVFRITLDSAWHRLSVSEHILPRAFDGVTVVEREVAGRCVLAFIDRASKQVFSVTSVSRDTLRIVQTVTLPVDPMQVVAADFTNDRRPDLLITDRNTPGIVPLASGGNGRFTVRRAIATDNAVGAMAVTALNDDELVDFVIYDWVKSELHMFYGVGGGRFIDQSVFPVDGEAHSVKALRGRGKEPARLLVSLASPPELQIWNGTEFGDFLLANRVPLDGPPASVAVGDLDGDGAADIVALLRSGDLQAFFAGDSTSFARATSVSVPGMASLQLIAPERSGILDAIVSGAPDAFWALRNAVRRARLTDTLELLTGRQPSGILAADLNHDGQCDAVVITAADQGVETYWGRGRNGILGAVSYSLNSRPSSIVLHHSADSTVSLLIGSWADRSVSFVSFSFDGNTFSNAVIPTEGRPSTLAPFPGARGVPGFAVLNALGSDERFALSFFEQVGGDQFLEQSFRLASPDSLLGASITDLNQAGFPGIIYAYRPADTTGIEVSAAFGDSMHVMKRNAILQDLPVRATRQARMWVADLDGDDTLDVLVHCSAPANQFFLLHGRSGGAFESPLLLASGFDVHEQTDVRILDLDRDRVNEVILLDRERKRIVWFHAAPSADHTVRPLVEQVPAVAYDLGDFSGDGVLDLAVVLQDPDLLKIYSGARRWGSAASTLSGGRK
jgi:hypothetical protein